MRALKTLVVVLGIAVVIGFFGLVAGIVYKASRLADEPPRAAAPLPATSPPVPPPPAAAAPAPWGRVGLDQPAGTRIQSIAPAGALIVLHLYTDAPGQDERVVVVDPATGRVLGTIAPGAP